MTPEEADRHLHEYRATLKAWTMAISGVSDEDASELYGKLEEHQSILAQIALDFPDRAHAADTLIRSRTRMIYQHTEAEPLAK